MTDRKLSRRSFLFGSCAVGADLPFETQSKGLVSQLFSSSSYTCNKSHISFDLEKMYNSVEDVTPGTEIAMPKPMPGIEKLNW